MDQKGIVLLGLGPGDPGLLTREALDWLQQVEELYVITKNHPAVAALPDNISCHSFDPVFGSNLSAEQVNEQIILTILQLGQRSQGVTYAVPGHPLTANAICTGILQRARVVGIPVKIIAGVSLVERTFQALSLDPQTQITIIDALSLSKQNTPSFPPSQPSLITQVTSSKIASKLMSVLLTMFSEHHEVALVHAVGTKNELVEYLPLGEIDQSTRFGFYSSLYCPPLPFGSAFEDFHQIIAQLRSPEGCPWDREQTHASLKPYLIEESYEALEALDLEDMPSLMEELGDILLQIVLHAQIGIEHHEFGMSDLITHISDKMIRRHPHVFADGDARDVAGVIHKWEEIKAIERKDNGNPEKKGMLDGIPANLPALVQSQHIQQRAQRIGFDWPEISGVINKIYEELDELKQAQTSEERISETGDVLFAVVNLARWLDVDAESALRESNRRFKKRFAYIEQAATDQGKTLDNLSFTEMDALWDEAKLKFRSLPEEPTSN
jgi:tetrapyrrole methylase family protein/MazG family protein